MKPAVGSTWASNRLTSFLSGTKKLFPIRNKETKRYSIAIAFQLSFRVCH